MVLSYKEIGEIISLIDSSSCDEIVLETDEIKLVVRRRGAGNSASPATPGPVTASPPAIARSAAPAAPDATPAATKTHSPRPAQAGGVVASPMVGTFYRAPAPETPPFVEVGSKIKAGDPLCVIEVMKLFTTIHAEFGGTVREIGAENAQLVEFGQMLFVIDPE